MVRGEKLRKLLARVKHRRLDRILRHLDNLGDLLDGLFMIVNEVDHLAVLARHLGEAAAELRGAILLKHGLFRRVGGILDTLHSRLFAKHLAVTIDRGQGLEARCGCRRRWT